MYKDFGMKDVGVARGCGEMNGKFFNNFILFEVMERTHEALRLVLPWKEVVVMNRHKVWKPWGWYYVEEEKESLKAVLTSFKGC